MKTVREVKKELREEGFASEDIEKAVELMRIIHGLDGAVFSENPIGIEFVRKNPGNDFAGYVSATQTREESYCIYMPGLAKSLSDEKKKRKYLFSLKGGKLVRTLKGSCWSWRDILFGIAAHEVRHRLQAISRIKKFSPGQAKLFNDPLKGILEYLEILFECQREEYRRKGKSEKYIREKTGRKEFNAQVIEYLVAQMLHRRKLSAVLIKVVDAISITPL